jgi:hypothetical protein
MRISPCRSEIQGYVSESFYLWNNKRWYEHKQKEQNSWKKSSHRIDKNYHCKSVNLEINVTPVFKSVESCVIFLSQFIQSGNSDYLKAFISISPIISTQFCIETQCARRISVIRKSRSALQDNPVTTPSNRALLKKLVVSPLVKKFPEFYANRMFIAVFKKRGWSTQQIMKRVCEIATINYLGF